MSALDQTRAAEVDAGLSKSQRAYHWIKERIAGQEFTPGYRLVLGSIAGELDMSVVPVREGLVVSPADGSVEMIQPALPPDETFMPSPTNW